MFWALFWILALGLTAAAAALATMPLWRDRDNAPARAAHDVAVFKSQLREIDRDLARGALSEAEAEGARREISKRLLAADSEASKTEEIGVAPEGAARAALIGLAAPLLVGAAVVYLLLGSPGLDDAPLAKRSFQAELEAGVAEARRDLPPTPPNLGAPAPSIAGQSVEELVPRLEQAVARNPNDPRGHELLGRLYSQQERYAEAWRSIGRAIELVGPSEAAIEMLPIQGEAMVLAAGGVVSPEAEAVFQRAPRAERSRYFLALALVQRGSTEAGLQQWSRLARETENPTLRRSLNQQIAALAAEAGLARGGVEGGQSPDRSPNAEARGPTADDVEAASELNEGERREMIGGMLDRLEARLAENPDDLDGWLRLIRSRRTFGQDARAAEALAQAKGLFAENPEAIALLNRAGSEPVPRLAPEPEDAEPENVEPAE
ncbi:MAG: c-type cytochrome biogenesis protein CcmI [Pseudomonadota bacterium]